MKTLDVIAIGRSSVDLYGAQVGGRLEDMASFDKYVGGSPTNIAVGAARLGLRSALITRVGDEHMGRFVVEELRREGVDVGGIRTDPERLTALVLLGIRDRERFPLIFYRENCADMALSEDDIDPDFVRSARAVVATGTHLSHPGTEAAVRKALDIARADGARTALDIDYRPNLWGLGGHGDGESRFVADGAVTARLKGTLHLFDLIVGTEEEFRIAGGHAGTVDALRAVRAVSDAVLVCKRGPTGAAAFAGAIPDSLDEGESGPGFPIEVFNVLGAGDGFMSGLLCGWLGDRDWKTALTWANACGALAVSRHGCAPAYPSREELDYFLGRGMRVPALRHDRDLEQVHWHTNRGRAWPEMRVFAFDHRRQFEEMEGATPERIGRFKGLCLRAAVAVAAGRAGYGILCDSRFGQEALWEAAGSGLWIGRPVEWPGSRPLALEPEIGPDFGGLSEWPLEHVVKVLCLCHPDDDEATWADQIGTLTRLFHASRRNRLEMLLELVPSRLGAVEDGTTGELVRRVCDAGIHPDWWKLEPFRTDAAWRAASAAIAAHDPGTRGIVVLGLDAPEAELAESLALAASHELVRGFAVGRTIFGDTARKWMTESVTDDEAVAVMEENYGRLCGIWDRARARAGFGSGSAAPERRAADTEP